jgi:thioredoxin reductase
MKEGKGSGLYNVVVIGAGTAGLVTAAGTASLGGRVALIERHKMGGDCLNFGCVPSKALISSARLIHNIRRAEDWGLEKQEPKFAFAKILDRMRARRAEIAPNDSQDRFESLGVDVFRGEAKFVSPHELEVDGRKLRARNFVIATGTRATIPPIEGIDLVPYFTNETIFDELKSPPQSLIVLGGGPIGCELGQAFARLGVQVTILNRGERLKSQQLPLRPHRDRLRALFPRDVGRHAAGHRALRIPGNNWQNRARSEQRQWREERARICIPGDWSCRHHYRYHPGDPRRPPRVEPENLNRAPARPEVFSKTSSFRRRRSTEPPGYWRGSRTKRRSR